MDHITFEYDKKHPSPFDEWCSERMKVLEFLLFHSKERNTVDTLLVRERRTKELEALIEKQIYFRKWFWHPVVSFGDIRQV